MTHAAECFSKGTPCLVIGDSVRFSVAQEVTDSESLASAAQVQVTKDVARLWRS